MPVLCGYELQHRCGGADAAALALARIRQIRPLASDDHRRGHLTLLRVLTQAPELDAAAYGEVFDDMRCRGRRGGYYPLGTSRPGPCLSRLASRASSGRPRLRLD